MIKGKGEVGHYYSLADMAMKGLDGRIVAWYLATYTIREAKQ
jgi:hypothetical protein